MILELCKGYGLFVLAYEVVGASLVELSLQDEVRAEGGVRRQLGAPLLPQILVDFRLQCRCLDRLISLRGLLALVQKNTERGVGQLDLPLRPSPHILHEPEMLECSDGLLGTAALG